jgi:sulfur-oxidizing protein SoxY
MLNIGRRTLFKQFGACAGYVTLVTVGLLKPLRALAADWNKAAFEARGLAAAANSIGGGSAVESLEIQIKAPSIAEDGAAVPVEVVSNIPETTMIALLVEKNPTPLAGHFTFANGALPEISLQLKMVSTSMLKVIVQANGKYYFAQKEVKVTQGPCACESCRGEK